MAPKVKLTAALFQERYGDLVSEHFSQYTTAHTLRVALSERKPPIIVTDGMLKMWYHGFHSASSPPAVQWRAPPSFLNFLEWAGVGATRRRQCDGGGLAELFSPPRFCQGIHAKIVVLEFAIHPVSTRAHQTSKTRHS